MTLEKAIELKAAVGRLMYSDNKDIRDYNALIEFIDASLRPVSREQVEKAWKGNWKFEPDVYDSATYVCSKCGEPWTLIDGTPVENNMNFCPVCGAAQTDEAVEMVMRRLEALKDGKGD